MNNLEFDFNCKSMQETVVENWSKIFLYFYAKCCLRKKTDLCIIVIVIQSLFCSWFTTVQLPDLYPKSEATGSDIFYVLLLYRLVFGFLFCPIIFLVVAYINKAFLNMYAVLIITIFCISARVCLPGIFLVLIITKSSQILMRQQLHQQLLELFMFLIATFILP